MQIFHLGTLWLLCGVVILRKTEVATVATAVVDNEDGYFRGKPALEMTTTKISSGQTSRHGYATITSTAAGANTVEDKPRRQLDEPHVTWGEDEEWSRIETDGVGHPISNRCADLDLSLFDPGKSCGFPLSAPCFNFTRCQPAPDGTGFTIYVYDNACTLDDSDELPTTDAVGDEETLNSVFREAARMEGLLADTYESACVFVHARNVANHRLALCAPKAPLWNNGANHLMVDLTDFTR